jgi:zinc-binding alcohol dehydrogenase family protein
MTATMRAVGYRKSLPISEPASLEDVEVDIPTPNAHDLLVRIEAVSVNPVDTLVRIRDDPGGKIKILGYDAGGTVESVGSDVTRFGVGDAVFYAGSIGRPGTDAQFHLVDEHIVGHKPVTLTFAEAAAMPLTSITAWEALFEKFALTRASTGTLLVIGAAGGVGSMAVQLARARTGLTVIGTASRPESHKWVTDLGAHHVIDRHGGLADATLAVAPDGVDYVISPFSAGNVEQYARLLRPNGHITAIDEPADLNIVPLKPKSISWHWEFMFTRPLQLPTDPAQHEILERIAALVDNGQIRTTMTAQLSPINATTLREAHRRVETSGSIGKTVIAGSFG